MVLGCICSFVHQYSDIENSILQIKVAAYFFWARCFCASRVVLKRSKLPMSLIKDQNVGGNKEAVTTGGPLPKLRGDALVALEPFEGVFGSKKTRKRPRLQAADLTTLASQVRSTHAFLRCVGPHSHLGSFAWSSS